MSDKLTVKQENFVQDVFKGKTYTQAYRDNYDTKDMLEKTVWEAASRLIGDYKVAARLIELQEEAAERSQVTVESITKELEEARLLAAQEAQVSSMVSASMGKAKVHGLLVDKVQGDVTINIPRADSDL